MSYPETSYREYHILMNRKRHPLLAVPLLVFLTAILSFGSPAQALAAKQNESVTFLASGGPSNSPDLEDESQEDVLLEGTSEEPLPEEWLPEEALPVEPLPAELLSTPAGPEQFLPGNDPADVELISSEVIVNPTDGGAALVLSPEALPEGITALTVSPIVNNSYIANSGIGWQEAHRVDTPLLPETVSYRRPEYNWKLLNPAPGVYNWAPLDADLQLAIAQGKQFSFRIYTMRGIGSGGGHQLPGWTFDRGAALRSNGEPDYANCTYQTEWGRFVDALRARYDGNPNIAFIDISGYGQYNEWNYGDYTTWEDGTLDSMSRQRLADAFIGGSATIQCRDLNWRVQTVSYNYTGFRRTQLIMPYGGIQKTSRYVAGRRPDVGIRHDCLGSSRFTDGFFQKIGDVVAATWRNAPIIFEFCNNSTSEPNFFSSARATLEDAHGSIVHDNLQGRYSASVVGDAIRLAGYRYVLRRTTFPSTVIAGEQIEVAMTWANTGYAPAYVRMGQDFWLRVYLLDANGRVQYAWTLQSDPNTWMPADPLPGTPPDYNILERLRVPGHLAAGTYTLATAIINTRDWYPVRLAVQGMDRNNRYLMGQLRVTETNRVLLPITTTNEPTH
jgi:hypothetical protein